ncbi:MAG: rRNA pseudouridine synthase [Phycisphaeraceae bacterium]|nr:rRNA pseudouridine synthase [Phycisphaeraceae bacterium]MCW5754146.1 rRNA pseudouridine synthase [Phycisphaeraceae bacterium]
MPPRGRSHPELPPLDDARRGERLQRVMADAGVAARRDCEKLILDGAVTVNGKVVRSLPVWVHPKLDRIAVRGRPLPEPERHIYLMLNKPPRTLTTAADEPGADRRTVLDLVNHPSRARLFPVGRLDYDTTGLLLLTNDGDFANAITHPRNGLPKTYLAVVNGRLEDDDVQKLEEGIYLAERKAGRTVGAVRTARVRIEIFARGQDRTVLRLTLKEGRNRQVRRMLAAVRCPVRKLERVAIGPVTLSNVARGRWRELTREELRLLREGIKRASAPAKKPRTPSDDSTTRSNARGVLARGVLPGSRHTPADVPPPLRQKRKARSMVRSGTPRGERANTSPKSSVEGRGTAKSTQKPVRSALATPHTSRIKAPKTTVASVRPASAAPKPTARRRIISPPKAK